MNPMHPSVHRLLDCARTATAKGPAGERIQSLTALRKALGVSSATLTNWKSRGVSTEGMLAAQEKWGCPPDFVRHGSKDWMPQHHTLEGASSVVQAHEMGHYKYILTPHAVEWGPEMFADLGAEFQTTMPDASMAPLIARGARIIFITGVQPLPGDVVLVTDGSGTPYVREYRQLTPGHWQAHALNPAYLPLDCVADQLTVVAIFDGQRGRRCTT